MKRKPLVLAVALACAPLAAGAQAPAPAARPNIPQVCLSCHKAEPNAVQGIFENVAFKSKSIQLKIDAYTEIVPFDPATLTVVDAGVTKPAEALRDIAKNREARIDFVEKDGKKVASRISFKGPIKLAPEKLVSYDDVVALVAQGPEKGNYTLVDSRPHCMGLDSTSPSITGLALSANLEGSMT